MTTPLLTIGMAHYDDFSGLYPTIQNIRLNNLPLMRDIEFLVVDNSPEDTKTSEAIQGLLGSFAEGAGAKYVPLPGNKGTSLSRDAIFKHASGKYVAVMDCHIQFWPGALARLLEHYKTDPESKDILTGPLIYDSLRNISTHFDPFWDDGMWGKWGQAWKCSCGPEGTHFACVKNGSVTSSRRLQLEENPVEKCSECGKTLPIFTWEGHEHHLIKAGFYPLGFNEGPAFEIPGQGLGFFSCRREAWVGFNPHALGFGGEELYVQEKFRRAGGRALCLPALKWNHRFYRTGGAKYPNTNFWKCRNYVLEFNELGWDVEPVRKHFLETENPLISQYAWDALMDDPIGNTTDPTARREAISKAASLLPQYTNAGQIFHDVRNTPRDLDQHMPILRALAGQAEHVVELTGRKESTIAFLDGAPKTVTSFSTEVTEHCYKMAHLLTGKTEFRPRDYQMGQIVLDLPDNDLLFIDTFHRYGQLLTELQTYAPHCRRWIVLHDTEIYGERGDDLGLGLRQAIAEFCDQHQEWAVIDHSKEQYGLTIMSRLIDDRPATPIEGFGIPHGPGTELKKLLHGLGIHPSPTCPCNSRAAQMDIWGITGCEDPTNFAQIVAWMSEGTWSELTPGKLLSAATKAIFSGLAFQLDPLHPFESLVSLVIKRAKDVESFRASKKVEAKAA